jgi:hypothetical protein
MSKLENLPDGTARDAELCENTLAGIATLKHVVVDRRIEVLLTSDEDKYHLDHLREYHLDRLREGRLIVEEGE